MIFKRFMLTFLLLVSSFSMLQLQALVKHPEGAEFAVFNKNKTTITYLRGYRKETIQLSYELVKMDVRSGEIIKRTPYTSRKPFAATPDGFKLLAKMTKGIAVIHNGTGKILRTLPYPDNLQLWQYRRIRPVISANSVLLAVVSESNMISLIHIGTGKVLRTIDAGKLIQNKKHGKPLKLKKIISAMQFSQNNRLFAFETRVKGISKLHLYDYFKQIEVARIALPRTSTSSRTIRFSRNAQQVMIYSDRHAYEGVAVVDLKSQKVTLKKRNAGYFTYADFTSNDRNIISYTPHNKTLLIENIKTGVVSKYIYKELPQHHSITQSTDGSLLIFSMIQQNSREKDGFLLVNTNTGEVVKRLIASAKPAVAKSHNSSPKPCDSLHALKKGELAADRDSRVSAVKGMTSSEADLIASPLFTQIVATGRHKARPVSSVKKDIESGCRMFAANMGGSQSWLGATFACIYPKCVAETTAKLVARTKR